MDRRIPTASSLREDWLRDQETDNFDHLVAEIGRNEFVNTKDGNLAVTVTFQGGNGVRVPKEDWFKVLEQHLRETGFGIASRKVNHAGAVELKLFF